jgi:hypothetical protein
MARELYLGLPNHTTCQSASEFPEQTMGHIPQIQQENNIDSPTSPKPSVKD